MDKNENEEVENEEVTDESKEAVNQEEKETMKEEKTKEVKREEVKEEIKEKLKEGKTKNRKFMKEFKEFALRGNMLDLAVGVLIGGAFQKLVTSLTDNLISPILGLFGGVNFSEYSWKIGKLNLKYGAFITDVINFIIMAFVIFLIVKLMNKLAKMGHKEKKEEEEATTKTCPHCYSEINIKADRCPYCTSELEVEEEGK